MANYHISRKAVSDIDGIWEYTLITWSEEQALKYYNQIYSEIQKLAESPIYLGKTYNHIKNGLMGYRVGHHIIFYRRRKDNDVMIVRVLHERMDFPRHL